MGGWVPEGTDPLRVALRLRPPQRRGVEERFTASDPPRSWDLTRNRRIARLVGDRRFQFLLILPNQIIFWTVIFVGFLGTADPGLNFATAITWYIWFALVFVMMVLVGRAWCAMCPFGGFAEWVQRRSLWRRTQKALGLGRTFPEPLARYGFLLSVGTFLGLTWIEEYFNIAGPGSPAATSWMVVGIVASALTFFLVFERRTFCRYLCPLSALIGTVGSVGSVAGFRTRDREVCLDCRTKDCMRGGEEGFGCPWYTWQASADSNLSCGLCSECYKACPEGNVGLFLQKPLTSVITPRRRRVDIAWAVVVLWGLVLYQQVNATNAFAAADNWLNRHLGFPHYPNPVDYVGFIAIGAAATAGVAWLIAGIFASKTISFVTKGPFLERTSRFRSFFVPLAYGLIPVVGADYFARQLPKFFQHAPRIVPSVQHIFGFSGVGSPIYSTAILSNPWIVAIQVVVIALGTLASSWATVRIVNRELVPLSTSPMGIRIASGVFVAACGVAAAVLYVIMHAAD